MHDERDRYLDQAREFLGDLKRPSAYAVLGVDRSTPTAVIHKAFTHALRQRERTGYNLQDIVQAQDQLKDTRKRLELDARSLDREQWSRQLDNLRNRYTLFDFLADLRGS